MAAVSKIQYFESLRGIAALLIVLRHGDFIYNSPLTTGFIAGQSYLMVDFFFVLSGWVIALNYIDRIKTPKSILTFQAKRLLRLYPLHIVTLLAALVIEVLRYIAESRLGMQPHYPAFELNNGYHFALNVVFLQVPFGEHISWNTPSWSIAAEVITYLLFALLVFFGRRWKYWLIAATAVFGFVMLLPYAHNFNQSVGMPPVYRCFMAFMLGALMQKVSRSVRFQIPPETDYVVLGGITLALAFPHLIMDIVYPFLFAGGLLALSLSGVTYAKMALENRVLVFLGTISYGIYMIHTAVWWFLSNFIRVVFKPTMINVEDQVFQQDLGLFGGLFVHALGIAITIGAATLSYRYLETPVSRLRKRYLKS